MFPTTIISFFFDQQIKVLTHEHLNTPFYWKKSGMIFIYFRLFNVIFSIFPLQAIFLRVTEF